MSSNLMQTILVFDGWSQPLHPFCSWYDGEEQICQYLREQGLVVSQMAYSVHCLITFIGQL